MKDAIQTYTGKYFRPLAPVVKDIDIWDIAHALANECRFNGHCRIHYGVGEHSVRVANLVRDWGGSREEQRWGLLHDASEAYLRDLPKPLKDLPDFKWYREAEDRLMRAVCLRFGLPPVMPEIVARADRVMLATEMRDVMHGADVGVPPLASRISVWGPEMARYEFLKRFDLLKEAR